MSVDRLTTVLRALVEVDGRSGSVVDRACAATVGLLAVDGAGLSLMVDGDLRGAVGSSDPWVDAVQELQSTLGEGPCVDAWSSGRPALAADLADPRDVRWSAFGLAGAELGVGAVFAFPLGLGAIRIGVLVAYRGAPGRLTDEHVAMGLVLADVATQAIIGLQAGASDDALHDLLAGEPPHWAEVHQATGMLSVQLGVALDEAFVRMRSHAFAVDVPLRVIAAEVVARRLRLPALLA